MVERLILEEGNERVVLASQDNATRTNWIKRMIDKQDISQKCKICGEADKTVSHIVAECKMMAHEEYKISRHTTKQ